jgi:site-specific recombinase XerC
MLQVAVEKQKILSNPCERFDPPRVPTSEMTFLDWDEAIRLSEAHSDRYRTLIYVVVDSGMRWSELVGPGAGRSTRGMARSVSPNSSSSWTTDRSCGRNRRPPPASDR